MAIVLRWSNLGLESSGRCVQNIKQAEMVLWKLSSVLVVFFLWDFIKYHFWFMDQVTMTWKHLWGPKEPFLTYKILVMFSRVLRLNILYFKSLCYYDPISKNQSSVSYICLWKHNSAESEEEDLEDCHYTCSEGDLHEVKLMEAVEGAGRLLTVVAWQFDSFKVI